MKYTTPDVEVIAIKNDVVAAGASGSYDTGEED